MEKDVETNPTTAAGGGAHGLRGGSSSEQGTLAEKEAEQAFASSDELEKGEKTKMAEERKSFGDVEETADSEPYQEVSFPLSHSEAPCAKTS